tara:strand:- start:28123 stop:28989 length:867 start_codon:yes stop_codon:yes gene_type:complete
MIDREFEVAVSELNEWTPKKFQEWDFEINDFAIQVQKEMRGIKFGVKANGSYQHKKFVYMEGYPYTMGYLHYDDPRENAEQKVNHFCVSAPTIQNGKYADYNQNYAMKMSVNLEQGVKNAKRYLQPVPWGVVAHMNFSLVRHAFNKERNVFEDAFEGSKNDLGLRRDTLVPELTNLIDSGHVFLDKDLHEKIVDLVAKRKAYEEDKRKRCDLYFVYAFIKWDKETYIVIEIDNDVPNGWRSLPHKTYDADTLPDQLKGRVMSLNVLEQDTFVDGVGYKARDNMFYVSR